MFFIMHLPLHFVLFCLEILLVCFMIYHSIYGRYPYEAIRVITADGYILLLERIPR